MDAALSGACYIAMPCRWFREQLPQDLHDSKRQPAHLTQPELVKLVRERSRAVT